MRHIAHSQIALTQLQLPSKRKAFDLADHDLQAGMMLMTAYRCVSSNVDARNTAHHVLKVVRLRNQFNPQDESAAYVRAMALIELGEIEEAKQWADIAVALASEDSRQSYNLACLLSMLGQTDQAIEQTRKTLQMGCSERKKLWMRDIDPDMKNVRSDPRFTRLFD